MGMFRAVRSVYANMFDFSGRARRAEYWWFILFTFLVSLLIQGGTVFWIVTQPELAARMDDPAAMQLLAKEFEGFFWRWSLVYFGVMLFAYWIPYLAVTVRRLHDTDRSGWWMFKPILIGIAAAIGLAVLAIFLGGGQASPALALMAATAPSAAMIWFIVVLCLPGTNGPNRFGPDPISDRPREKDTHPALVRELDEELNRMVEERRKAEFQDYYRARVLPAIERTKTAKRSLQ